VWFRSYPVGQTDTQTDPQTGILVTILYNRSRGQSNYRIIATDMYMHANGQSLL